MLNTVITCKRAGDDYLSKFINSYLKSCNDKLYIFTADGLNTNIDRLIVMNPSEQFIKINSSSRVHKRHTLNYVRPLIYANNLNQEVLIFEDDTELAPDWLGYFERVKKEHENERCIVTLYSAGAHVVDGRVIPTIFRWDTTKLTSVYPKEHFFGTQAIYYPKVIVNELLEFLYSNGVKQYTEPTDLLIKNFCIKTNTPIYVTSYSLVQHTGINSTGLGNFHYATNLLVS